MRCVLVTGGAGFIGSNFLNLMVPRHPQVTFVNADKLTYAANLHSLEPIAARGNYRFERCDLADRAAVRALFGACRPDAVVHFAAESHVDRSLVDPSPFVEANVIGTFNLLEAARATWRPETPARFHHVSTDEVFGSLGETGLFTETTAYDPSSPYSASKAASDHFVRAYHRSYGLPVTLSNCSNNYGPRQFPEKLIPLMILNALERRPLPVYGQGLNMRDWLYVDDHCEAVWRVLTEGRVGRTYNVGGGTAIRNLEVVRLICRLVAEELACPLGELETLITFVQDRPGHDYRYAMDTSRIEAELGWRPRETFETGLRKTVRWYLANRTWVEQVRTGEYREWMRRNYEERGTPAPPSSVSGPDPGDR